MGLSFKLIVLLREVVHFIIIFVKYLMAARRMLDKPIKIVNLYQISAQQITSIA